MLKIFFIFILFSISVQGRAKDFNLNKNEVLFKMKDKYLAFYQHPKEHYFISRNCWISKNCLANKAIMGELKIQKKNRNAHFGGKNPGSAICKLFDNTKVILLKDLKGHEQSFCQFSDRSSLSTGALVQIYKKDL